MHPARAATLIGILALAAASACATVRPTPVPASAGRTVVLGDWQAPDTLNPLYALRTVDYTAAQLAFTPLFRTRADFTREPVLLSEVPLLSNGGVVLVGHGMDVTWRFREGMRWSDGTPIGCDDLIATWRWVTDPANVGLAAGVSGWELISSIDGPAATSCVMHFREVYGGYLSFITVILPARYLASVPVADAHALLYPMADPSTAVYSGPFMPARVTADQIDYRPNPNWRTISGHDPNLAAVTLRTYGSPAAMVSAYRAGEIDVAQDLSDPESGLVAPIDATEVSRRASLSYELLSLNDAAFERRFGTDHPRIKRAIALAVDRQLIVARTLDGGATTITSFVPRQAWYYREEAAVAPDAAGAARLLENAGWMAGADGIRAKGGTRLSLVLCTNPAQVRIDTLTLVASELKAVGIEANVRIEPSSSMGGGWADVAADTPCNLARGNFDIAEFAFTAPADPFFAYATYHSSSIPDGNPRHSGFNITRTNVPAMDAALEIVRSSVDQATVKSAMAIVQDLYVQETVEIPLYARSEMVLVARTLHDVDPEARWDGVAWNIGDWSASG